MTFCFDTDYGVKLELRFLLKFVSVRLADLSFLLAVDDPSFLMDEAALVDPLEPISPRLCF